MQQLTELWKSIHLAQKRFTSAMDVFRNIILNPFRPLRPDSSSSPKPPVADWQGTDLCWLRTPVLGSSSQISGQDEDMKIQPLNCNPLNHPCAQQKFSHSAVKFPAWRYVKVACVRSPGLSQAKSCRVMHWQVSSSIFLPVLRMLLSKSDQRSSLNSLDFFGSRLLKC